MPPFESFWLLLSFGDQGWADDLLRGTVATIILALGSLGVGVQLGVILALMRLSKILPLRWTADLIVLIVRGTPEFLIILLIFFGLSAAVNGVFALVGLNIELEIPKYLAALTSLSIIFASYASEVFRGAYLAIPSGQIEAGKAIGMSARQIFFRVRLPQIWRFALPGLGNLWMVLLKDCSLVAVIAYDELIRVAKVAAESTTFALFFYLAAAIIYLILTAVSDRARLRLEALSMRGFKTHDS